MTTNLQSMKKRAPLCFIEAYSGVYKRLKEEGIYEYVKESFRSATIASCFYHYGSYDDMDMKKVLLEAFLSEQFTEMEIFAGKKEEYFEVEKYERMKRIISAYSWMKKLKHDYINEVGKNDAYEELCQICMAFLETDDKCFKLNIKLQESYKEKTIIKEKLQKAWEEKTEINKELQKTYKEKSEINAKLKQTYAEKSEINAKLKQAYAEKSEINAKLKQAYAEKSEINAKLKQAYVEKSEINAKLKKTYDEKAERGRIIKELEIQNRILRNEKRK